MFVAKMDYFETSEGLEVLEALKDMATSEEYFTYASYTPHSVDLISFIEKHKEFIRKHPNTNAQHYVANLKIMCKRR
jgi:hypothetical protein